jgi:hypothetical protein
MKNSSTNYLHWQASRRKRKSVQSVQSALQSRPGKDNRSASSLNMWFRHIRSFQCMSYCNRLLDQCMVFRMRPEELLVLQGNSHRNYIVQNFFGDRHYMGRSK